MLRECASPDCKYLRQNSLSRRKNVHQIALFSHSKPIYLPHHAGHTQHLNDKTDTDKNAFRKFAIDFI